MKHAFIGAALSAALLSSCAALQTANSFTVSQNNVDAARSAYTGAFLTPVAAYRSLGICPAGTTFTLSKPCADRAVMTKLQAATVAVRNAFDATQAQIDSGNASGITAAYTFLQTQITAAEALAATLPTAKSN